MKRAALLLPLLLTACGWDSAPKDLAAAAESDKAALDEEQKSIEEAADAAAKLVEEDAREEIARSEAANTQ